LSPWRCGLLAPVWPFTNAASAARDEFGSVAAREGRGGERGRPGRVLERRNSRIGRRRSTRTSRPRPPWKAVRLAVAHRAAREVDRDHLVGLSRSVGEVRRVEDDAVRQLDERAVAVLADRARIAARGGKPVGPGMTLRANEKLTLAGKAIYPVTLTSALSAPPRCCARWRASATLLTPRRSVVCCRPEESSTMYLDVLAGARARLSGKVAGRRRRARIALTV
jgi:hypothetical protein